MSDANCHAANSAWHSGHDKRVEIAPGGTYVICGDCLAVATLADTWVGGPSIRGARAVFELGEAKEE